MPNKFDCINAPSPPNDVVKAWCDIFIYTDTKGIVRDLRRAPVPGLPDAAKPGSPFWQSLALGTHSLDETLQQYPLFKIHEISCRNGHSFLLRIIPIHPDHPRKSGYVIIVTDNQLIETLRKAYKERLVDNIATWADSITIFNMLFDTAKDATFLLHENGTILAANVSAQKQHGNPEQTLAGNSFLTLLENSSHPELAHALQTLQPRGLLVEKVSARDGNGRNFPAEARLRKITFAEHSLFRFILRDLTAHVEMKQDLQEKKIELKEMNITLRHVIRSLEKDKQKMREQFTSQVKKQILPALEKIAASDVAEAREGYKSVIEDQLKALVEGDAPGPLGPELLRLSPREMEVCQLIQMGRNGAEISLLLNMAFETVQTHRKNIRRKLNLRGTKLSLLTYLRQISLFS